MNERAKNIGLALIVGSVLTTVLLIDASKRSSGKSDSGHFEIPTKIYGNPGTCYSTGEFIPEDRRNFTPELLAVASRACNDFVTHIKGKDLSVVECGSLPLHSRLTDNYYFDCYRLSSALRLSAKRSIN